MIGYPFDSQVTFDQQGNPQYDRAISSKPLKELIRKLFTTGVMPNPSNNLQVVEGVSGLTTIVKAGFCIIEGGLKLEEEDKTMMHQAADATYDRIDTVVMRWNDNDNARICSLYVVEGTPSATPVRPTLNREGSVYEIGLADVLIKANSTAISQQRITDTRYESARCGVIHSISEYDTTYIYEQVQADLAGFKADEEADFLAWFDEMKDQLSEDAAGHLQLEIDEIKNAPMTETNTALAKEGTVDGNVLLKTHYGMSVQNGTPTPSSPVAIENAKANYRDCGKNLIPYPYNINATGDFAGGGSLSYQINTDGSITISGTANNNNSRLYITRTNIPFNVKNGIYTISAGVTSNKYRLEVAIFNNGSYQNVVYKTSSGDNTFGLTDTPQRDCLVFYIVIDAGATLPVTFKPMFRLASVTDSTYEPYDGEEIKTDLTLRAIEVTSSDDYNLVKDGHYYIADTIDWDEVDGYVLTRRVKETVFDGTEVGWGVGTSTVTGVVLFRKAGFFDYNTNTKFATKCNRFVCISSYSDTNRDHDGYISLASSNYTIYFGMLDSVASTVEQFKTWLSTNNVTVLTEQTPTKTPITSAQAKALLSLKSHETSTYISQTEDTEGVMVIEYPTSELTSKALTGYVKGERDKISLAMVNGVLGAKNLIPYPYYHGTRTNNGITFTPNADGTVLVEGTATADAWFGVRSRNEYGTSDALYIPNGRYTLSGTPSGGSSSTYYMSIGRGTDQQTTDTWANEYGSGITFQANDDTLKAVNITIGVKSGTAIPTGGIVFKPLLRLADDIDNTYQPYAKTNKQLTDALGGYKLVSMTEQQHTALGDNADANTFYFCS